MRLRVQLQGLGQSRRGCQEERVVSVPDELSGSPRCILSLKRSNAGKPLPPLERLEQTCRVRACSSRVHSALL